MLNLHLIISKLVTLVTKPTNPQVTELCQSKRTMTVLDPPTVISNNFDGGMNNTLICNIGSACHINMTMTQIHRYVLN